MIYYTQLIFIKEGAQDTFHTFEDNVLPLISEHNGDLVYRIRPDKNAMIAGSGELPYEIHLVTFPTHDYFNGYAGDPRRISFLHLKDASVKRMVLIEGKAL